MFVGHFHVFPLTLRQIPLAMQPPGGSGAPRLLDGAAIRQDQAKAALNLVRDARSSKPCVQDLPEPRVRVAEAVQERHIRQVR